MLFATSALFKIKKNELLFFQPYDWSNIFLSMTKSRDVRRSMTLFCADSTTKKTLNTERIACLTVASNLSTFRKLVRYVIGIIVPEEEKQRVL